MTIKAKLKEIKLDYNHTRIDNIQEFITILQQHVKTIS